MDLGYDETNSSPEDKSIYVDSETRIQILDTMLYLPLGDREQSAAFIVSFFFGICICI